MQMDGEEFWCLRTLIGSVEKDLRCALAMLARSVSTVEID